MRDFKFSNLVVANSFSEDILKRLVPISLVLISSVLIYSCNVDCIGFDLNHEREVESNLNNEARKNLNQISSILNNQTTTFDEYIMVEGRSLKSMYERISDVYFAINDDEQVFYIVDTKWSMTERRTLLVKEYKLPIKELNPDNIKITFFSFDFGVFGQAAQIDISSNYNNDESFMYRVKSFGKYLKTSKDDSESCGTTGHISFLVSEKDAANLKAAFTNFLNNIN